MDYEMNGVRYSLATNGTALKKKMAAQMLKRVARLGATALRGADGTVSEVDKQLIANAKVSVAAKLLHGGNAVPRSVKDKLSKVRDHDRARSACDCLVLAGADGACPAVVRFDRFGCGSG